MKKFFYILFLFIFMQRYSYALKYSDISPYDIVKLEYAQIPFFGDLLVLTSLSHVCEFSFNEDVLVIFKYSAEGDWHNCNSIHLNLVADQDRNEIKYNFEKLSSCDFESSVEDLHFFVYYSGGYSYLFTGLEHINDEDCPSLKFFQTFKLSNPSLRDG